MMWSISLGLFMSLLRWFILLIMGIFRLEMILFIVIRGRILYIRVMEGKLDILIIIIHLKKKFIYEEEIKKDKKFEFYILYIYNNYI